MAHHAERLTGLRGLPRARRIAVGLILCAMAALAFLVLHGRAAPGAGATQTHEQVMSLAPFQTSLSIVGAIVPDRGEDVLAPFDGAIRSVVADFGDSVTAGQEMLTLDTAEIDRQRGEAAQTLLRSQQAAREMAGWDHGIDVTRARRAVTSATLDLADTRRRIAETRSLLDKGLVARSEMDALQQQVSAQTLSLAAARDDYEATLKRGQGEPRQIAMLDYEAARQRLHAIDLQRAAAAIRAPATGILVRPVRIKSDARDDLHAGERLAQGDLIGTISRPGAFAVAFQLDERDVDAVHVGQDVDITGPGFAGDSFAGKIVRVAGQASPGTGDAAKSTFEAVARMAAPADARRVRIGMSCNVAVVTYRNPAAIIVPAEAIVEGADGGAIMVKRPGARGAVRIPVQVGRSGPQGVEILSGIRAGDTISWTTPPSAGAVP
jgi:multidrug resistance efflux pump